MGEDARARAYAAAEAAFGPLGFLDERTASARVDGRPILVTFHDTTRSRAGSAGGQMTLPFRITRIAVPLARTLPLIFIVENREIYVHVGSTPEVRTGDPGFDERYFVFGSPPEVVAAALDADARAWIASIGDQPPVGLEDSHVSSRWTTPGPDSKTTPEDLHRAARAQIHIAEAIVHAYDARYNQLRAEQGAAAADAWHAGAAAQLQRREEDRERLRIIVFAVLGVVALGIFALVMMIVLFASFAGC